MKDCTPEQVIHIKKKRDFFLAQYDRAIELGLKFKFYDALELHTVKRDQIEIALNKIKNLK